MTQKPDSAEFPQLDGRAQQVLAAVIREYIATAEPVASAQLVRGYKLDVSPATVRNELAALEEAGLLTHPHTSAGRVPTVPILLLLDREHDRFLAKRAAADAELVKPIDPGTLRRTVKALLAAPAAV